MRKMLVATAVTMLVLIMATPLMAQEDTSALSGAAVGMGPRSAAMGGAFVAVADDATALYWNPAGLANGSGLSWINSIVGRVENLGVVDDAKDVYDIITEMAIPAIDFDFIRAQADKLANRPVDGEIAAISAVGFGNAALGAYGIGGGQGVLTHAAGDPNNYVDVGNVRLYHGESVRAKGSALWQYSYGAALSRRLNDRLVVGATVRKMNVGCRDKDWTATVDVTATPPVTTQESPSYTQEDTATTVDIGVLYSPEPRLKFAGVVRNVTSPNLSLTDRAGVAPPISLKAEAAIDVGVAVTSPDGKRVLALDIHNLGGANGGDSTVHFGYEQRLGSVLSLRVGATQLTYTCGLGVDLGFLQLDLAVGKGHNDSKQAGLAANFDL